MLAVSKRHGPDCNRPWKRRDKAIVYKEDALFGVHHWHSHSVQVTDIIWSQLPRSKTGINIHQPCLHKTNWFHIQGCTSWFCRVRRVPGSTREVLRVKLINQSDESRDIIQIERHFLSFSLQRLLHLTEVSVFYLKCAFQMCPSLLSIIY